MRWEKHTCPNSRHESEVSGCCELRTHHVAKQRGEEIDQSPVSVGFSTRRQKKLPLSLDSILYVTEGTLLHLLENVVFLLILIGEAHERSVDVDVLLTQIRRLLVAQPRLKLIVMSATIDIGI